MRVLSAIALLAKGDSRYCEVLQGMYITTGIQIFHGVPEIWTAPVWTVGQATTPLSLNEYVDSWQRKGSDQIPDLCA